MDTNAIAEMAMLFSLGPVLLALGYLAGRRVERERGRLENDARIRRRRRRPRTVQLPADVEKGERGGGGRTPV